MSAPEKGPTILYADQEHSGLRLVIFLSLFAGYLVGFRVVFLLIKLFAPPGIADYSLFLSCAGGLPIALFLIWGLEKILKLVWHSGLSLTLDERGLYVNDQRRDARAEPPDAAGLTDPSPTMLWSARIGQINWYFRLAGYPRGGRERHVPMKWLCLASELQQDEARLGVYTLMPPEKAAAWIDDPELDFHFLNMAELYDSSAQPRLGPPARPDIPNRLLQTKDGRYWLAERRRWEFGIELTPDDFITLMRSVAKAAQNQTTDYNNLSQTRPGGK